MRQEGRARSRWRVAQEFVTGHHTCNVLLTALHASTYHQLLTSNSSLCTPHFPTRTTRYSLLTTKLTETILHLVLTTLL